MTGKPLYKSIFSTKAQKEITTAWEWYEERQKGLGENFYAELLNRVNEIEQFPERYPTRYKSYKESRLSTFPFLIIYRIAKRNKLIRIVSVFHTAQNPKKKYK